MFDSLKLVKSSILIRYEGFQVKEAKMWIYLISHHYELNNYCWLENQILDWQIEKNNFLDLKSILSLGQLFSDQFKGS